MIAVLIISLLIIVAVYFVQQPQFGGKPSLGELKKMQNSPNFKNGQFQNLHYTPQLTGDASLFKVMKEFFFLTRIKTMFHLLFCHQKRLIFLAWI